MTKTYEIRSGRRVVSTQLSVSPLQAAVDYAKSFGSADAEIMRVGVDCVSWRGARFTAVLVSEPEPGHESTISSGLPASNSGPRSAGNSRARA
jgi:hypothetical protein